MDRRLQWIVFGVTGAVVAAVASQWGQAFTRMIDQVVYEATVEAMQSGRGYYSSMDAALRDALGPAPSVRAFRLPTLFWVWANVGTVGLWKSLAAVAILASGWLIARERNPAAGVLVVGWLVMLVGPFGMWFFVEVWALPLLLLAVRVFPRPAAAGWTLAAALIRELAAPLLVVGVVVAWRTGRDWRPWVAGSFVWLAAFAWHAAAVSGFVDPDGEAAPLVGAGSVGYVVDHAGVLTGPVGLAVVIWAVWSRRGQPVWWWTLPLTVGIPLMGLLAYRPYWSFLVLPVAVMLASDPRPRRGELVRQVPAREVQVTVG